MTQPALKDFTPVDGITVAEGGQVRVELEDGLVVGSATYTVAVLRQLNAGAVLAAAEAAERLVSTATGLELVSSPARMGRNCCAVRSHVWRTITAASSTGRSPWNIWARPRPEIWTASILPPACWIRGRKKAWKE